MEKLCFVHFDIYSVGPEKYSFVTLMLCHNSKVFTMSVNHSYSLKCSRGYCGEAGIGVIRSFPKVGLGEVCWRNTLRSSGSCK